MRHNLAKNSYMEKLLEKFRYYSDRRFSTIAGTLVYFLLMSIAPFTLWLTLVFGNVDVEQILAHDTFEAVSPVIRYLKTSAESAASGAGIIFLITSLYSSTNFFYHLRRSGEIIYDCPRVKGGLKLRLFSVLTILATIIIVALIAGVSVIGGAFLENFMPELISRTIAAVFLTMLAFFAAVMLNIIACPYRMNFDDAVTGSLLTTALWLVFAVGFGIYTQFANPERLYGKIAAVIIFLLWSYAMMSCFVIGMINNGSYVRKKQLKKL